MSRKKGKTFIENVMFVDRSSAEVYLDKDNGQFISKTKQLLILRADTLPGIRAALRADFEDHARGDDYQLWIRFIGVPGVLHEKASFPLESWPIFVHKLKGESVWNSRPALFARKGTPVSDLLEGTDEDWRALPIAPTDVVAMGRKVSQISSQLPLIAFTWERWQACQEIENRVGEFAASVLAALRDPNLASLLDKGDDFLREVENW